MGDPKTLAEFVDHLQASGRYTFTRAEALQTLGLSGTALKNAAWRLTEKGRVVMPRRGFFVIVPLEYLSAGAPPPSWFIDHLMRFQNRPYYVGILSAAALHGAAHQQPQEFQVVTDKTARVATAGRARIRFFVKKSVRSTPVIPIKTETGTMMVSSPEGTALDLVRYAPRAGFIDNVATVLSELTERIDGKALVEAAKSEGELAHVQRLGYVLDLVGGQEVATPLQRWVRDQQPRPTPLRPGRGSKGAPKDDRWNIVVNHDIEIDE
ncbi:MAG: type IV toxin-antitoxin system AbiEi family antitoxin [Deltaproteobacteria bacterium]|nr:type IV toxin-antitoxin system AbiEi family antitoxin [Deltaproteobacteria bacterium]